MGHMTAASGGGTPTKAEDEDANTKVQVEESADENKIRFDTAGSERMIIDENGKVGIGTSSPASAVEVQGGLTTTGSVLTLSTKETTVIANDVLGRINFQAPLEASGTDAILPGASIHALATDTFAADNNETAIVLSTASSDAEGTAGGGLNERMRITSAGNVGIGTSSPDFPLHIVDGTTISSYSDLANAAATIESTSDGVVYGPVLKLYRNSPSAESGNYVGMIRFTGNANNQFGSGQVEHTYAQIYTQITDITGGSEDATLQLQAIKAGTETGRVSIAADSVTLNANLVDSDFVVNGSGGGAPNLIKADAALARVGIRTSSPIATLDVGSGHTFRNTRLLTVGLTSATTLTEADHAGRYVFVTGSGTVITLPDNQAAGVHFSLLSNDGNGFTLRTGSNSSSGDNMNGAQTDITVATRKGVTCISTGTDYVVIGA
jgi:hypothetical protein